MGFSTRAGDAPSIPSDGQYLRGFKDRETVVRFTQHPDDMAMFWEHNSGTVDSFPCTGERATCPGCTSDDERIRKATRRFGTYLILTGRERTITLPFRLPATLHTAIESRCERLAQKEQALDLFDRDYIVVKNGSGLDTTYALEPDEKYPLDVEATVAEVIPGGDVRAAVDNILESMFNAQWGSIDAPKAQPTIASAAAAKAPENVSEEIPF